MAEVQLRPEELDRLEDALEDLEQWETIDDPSPAVRARLADYRALLIASREALPMVEVPPGVLESVLAEARRSDDDVHELSAADDLRPQEDSWWSRVRKSFLIPTLAVVGSAALILVIVRPTMDSAPSAEDVGVVARVETESSVPAQQQAGQAAPSTVEQPPAAPAEEVAEPEAEEEEEGPLYEIATSRRSTATKVPGAVAGGEAADAAAVGDKRDANVDKAEKKSAEADAPVGWDAIERGDKARLGGDCFRASNEYHRALDDGNDSVRARAHVGLGLCAAVDGNTARAESHYEQARALDPEVGGYIDTQSSDETRKSKKATPRKKQSSRRKAAMPSDFESAPQSQSLPGDARNANPYKD